MLDKKRKEIDELDDKLINILSKRFKVIEDIASIKQETSLNTIQPERWQLMLKERIRKGEKLGLRIEFIKALFFIIHEESILIQKNISKNK